MFFGVDMDKLDKASARAKRLITRPSLMTCDRKVGTILRDPDEEETD
jgi:hypothetical protein